MISLPAIYVRDRPAPAMTILERLFAAGIALACLAPLLVAATVKPRGTGTGTHEALGLAPCGFLEHSRIPCASCGMTTAFAWFVRGNLPASFYLQPMGALLALGCGVTFWGAAYVAGTGRPVHRLFRSIPILKLVIATIVFALLAWGWKICIHLAGMDGWAV